MQIDELRWFVAVVDEANVTRAAEALHVSQPALSRSLRRLETRLGVRLFDRVGRSLEPNAHGRRLAEHARRALDEIDTGEAAVRRSADPETGEVRLGFLNTLGTWLVPELIGAYRDAHPRVRFRLRQESAAALIDGLLEGRHDLLVTSGPPGDPRIAWRGLLREPLRLAVPPDHRLAGRRRVRLAEVGGDPFVMIRPEYGLRGITDDLLSRAGIRPRIAFEGEDAETLRGLVAAGLGVALLPPPAVARPGVVELTVTAPRAAREIGVAWLDGHPDTPPVAAFKKFLLSKRGTLLPT